MCRIDFYLKNGRALSMNLRNIFLCRHVSRACYLHPLARSIQLMTSFLCEQFFCDFIRFHPETHRFTTSTGRRAGKLPGERQRRKRTERLVSGSRNAANGENLSRENESRTGIVHAVRSNLIDVRWNVLSISWCRYHRRYRDVSAVLLKAP